MYLAACAIPLIVLPGPIVTLPLIVQDPAGGAAAHDSAEPPEAPKAEPACAEELLDLLEVDAKSISNFTASLHRRAYDFGADETEVYLGVLFYENGEQGRRIAVRFTQKGTLVQGDGTPDRLELRERSEIHVFSGEWLVEKNEEDKQFIKRQIVKPGDTFDPLALDGPLPLPFGQLKADVVQLFEAELVEKPSDDSFLARNLKEVYGLKLTPKPGTPAAEGFETVTIYYDCATLLPAGLDAAKLGGNRETIWFFNQKRNPGIDPAVMDITIPTEPGWRIDVREFDDGR